MVLLSGLLLSGLGFGCRGPSGWADLKAEIRERFPGVEQISVDTLAQRLEPVQNSNEDSLESSQPILIDVRRPDEFAVSHLKGAVNLSGSELAAYLDRVRTEEGRERDVILYCSVGYRSSEQAAGLLERGYTGVYNLEGSIFEWANEGYPVFRAGEEVRGVHGYDEEWSVLLDREYRVLPEEIN